MHEIEKYALADSLMREVWQNYCIVFGAKMPSYPQFDATSKGIGNAGMYYPRTRTVWINLAYFHGGGHESLRETIAHELAHHIVEFMYPQSKQYHGPEFKYVMNQIGYDGDRCHRMNVGMAKSVARKDREQLFNLD